MSTILRALARRAFLRRQREQHRQGARVSQGLAASRKVSQVVQEQEPKGREHQQAWWQAPASSQSLPAALLQLYTACPTALRRYA